MSLSGQSGVSRYGARVACLTSAAAELDRELGFESAGRGRIQVMDKQNVYIVFIDGLVARVGYTGP